MGLNNKRDILKALNNYIIYRDGSLFSKKRKIFIKPYQGKDGYLYLRFNFDKRQKRLAVHRMLANIFIPNPKNKPEVNHKDGDKLNNCIDNLEWTTKQENCKHASLNKLYPNGEKHYNNKLSEQDILLIKRLYKYGIKQNEIAIQFNVCQSHISRIVNNKTKNR